MKSAIINVSEILHNAQKLIPVGFSSEYSFSEALAAEYFDNLIEGIIHPTSVFCGILIMEKSENDYTIIDGLQRIITINLLLCALCSIYKGTSIKNNDAIKKIHERYLKDGEEPKLKLTGETSIVYNKILFGNELEEYERSNNVFKTYQCFLDKINERKISGTKLFKALSKIQFMTIVTDKSEIPVRELYQTLNADKKESQINLITDFILQKEESSILIWQNIIDAFKDSQNFLESFLLDFLVTRIDTEVSHKGHLYTIFKNYYYKMSKYQDTQTILNEIFKYSKYYLRIINAEFDSEEIREQITKLNENGGKDTYPYLMSVLDDLENSHINTGAFLNILKMVNLFIKSREENSISGVDIDFSNLSKELNRMLVLKDYVPEIIGDNKITINEINNLSNFAV